MKRSLIVFATIVSFVVPAVCTAAPIHPGAYVSGFLGVSGASDTDVDGTDFLAPPPAAFNDRVRFDPGIFVGGTGGYDFGVVRVEGELSYKHAEIRSITESGFRFGNPNGNVGAFAVMFNSFFDLHNQSPVTPYFGGGIGFAALHISDTFGTTSGGNRALLYEDDDTTVFAYQAGAGLEVALNRRISLDVGYRYFGTSRATFDSTAITTSFRYDSHNGMVGVRVKF
jgi:opacity protein-like surface antigen